MARPRSRFSSLLSAWRAPADTGVPSSTAAPAPDTVIVTDSEDDGVSPNQMFENSRRAPFRGRGGFSSSVFLNHLTRVGTTQDPTSFDRFYSQRRLDGDERHALGRNMFARRALSLIPLTSLREGWTVEPIGDLEDARGELVDKKKFADKIRAYEEKLGLQAEIEEGCFRGRLDGIAACLLGVVDGRTPDQPVDWDNVETILWARVIGRDDFLNGDVAGPESPNFANSEHILITDIDGIIKEGVRYLNNSGTTIRGVHSVDYFKGDGAVRIHRDRVLFFETWDATPDTDGMTDALSGFFASMRSIRTAGETFSTLKFGIKDFWRNQLHDNGASIAIDRLRELAASRSAFNSLAHDKEREEVGTMQSSLGGVPQLANPFMVWLSAGLGAGVTQLFGVSPGGFGKGESERANMHEEARGYFRRYVAPELKRFHALVLVAKDGGLQLSKNTPRKIIQGDLSPPDEMARTELRGATIEQIIQLVVAGLVDVDEGRDAISKLESDLFPLQLDVREDEEAEAPAQDAQVGVWTASAEMAKSVAQGELPAEAAARLAVVLGPERFTSFALAQEVFEAAACARTDCGPGEGPTEPGALSGDPEDLDSEDDESSGWEIGKEPEDTLTAREIGQELRIPTVRAKRKAAELGIKPWSAFGGEPRYSLGEFRRRFMEENNTAPAQKLAVMTTLPDALASQFPEDEKRGTPHVTLLYVSKEADAKTRDQVRDAVRGALETTGFAGTKLRLDGLDAFDLEDEGEFDRVAYAAVKSSPSKSLAELHKALRAAVEALDIEVAHMTGAYVPHASISYLEPGQEFEGEAPEGEWEPEVELWWGDYRETIAPPLEPEVEDETAADAPDEISNPDDFDADAYDQESRDMTDEAKAKRIAEAYKKYHEAVNMGAKALKAWSETEWSKKASVSREPIARNLRLLETPREKWTLANASSAMRTVNFVGRMKGAKQGEPTKIDGREGPSKRDISLKNWAYNPGRDEAATDAPDWTSGAARGLPVDDDSSWDGAAAKTSVFEWAGFDGESPDPAKARRAFLLYDASEPELKGSYKLPFARVKGGKLAAVRAGLNAAASRLPQTDVPQAAKDRARAVLDSYKDED